MTDDDALTSAGPDGPESLSNADEQWIRNLLAQSLPAVPPLPPSVSEHWQQTRPRPRLWRTSPAGQQTPWQLAGAVAAIAATMLVLGIAANTVLSRESSPPLASGNSATANDQSSESSNARARALPEATSVSTSGLAYNPREIAQQVRDLLARRNQTAAPVPPAANSATDIPLGQALAPSSTADTGPVIPLGDQLITLPDLGPCFVELTGSTTRQPVLVDSGSYGQQAAVLISFTTEGDAERLDLWVVQPDCTAGAPHVLWFGRILRP